MPNRPARIVALGLLAGLGPMIARADLDDYVKAADPSFSWKVVDSKPGQHGIRRQTALKLTSQTWQGRPWTHDLQVYEPDELRCPDVFLLFITGGSNANPRASFQDAASGEALARACGARVAILPQVPNQPLMGGRTEDDLIAETFVLYLKTRDETLPLLFPMVKSAVRAMDALQDWAATESLPRPRFVVSGASKRGWTTWLSAAVDPRIIAIAPMVIPTLNMKEQNKHQLEVWGKYSDQIADYTRRGLMEKIETPEGTKLWKMIDPYSYLDRIKIPTLQINGTNDQYWTLDSMNLFWNDLKGPKSVVYLPNAGHGLEPHRDYAVNGVGALFRQTVAGRELPRFVLSVMAVAPEADRPAGSRWSLDLRATDPKPRKVEWWTAETPSQDFRPSVWTAELAGPIGDPPILNKYLPTPKTGSRAIFADLTFTVEGLDYHLSTPISIDHAPSSK